MKLAAPWANGDPHDIARAIVGDPRYTARTPAAQTRTWFDTIWDWIGSLLHRFFHALDHALGGANPFGPAIGFALIAAALALFAYFVYRLSRILGRKRSRRTPRQAAAAAAIPGSVELRQAARAAAGAGRYRTAAGLLFGAAARALDECGRVRYDAARTPGEYRRIVADPAFDELVLDAVVALFAATEPRGELFLRMTQNYDRFFGASG